MQHKNKNKDSKKENKSVTFGSLYDFNKQMMFNQK